MYLEERQTVGEKLVSLRGRMQQSEVATAVGISVSALSMYEQDKRIPRDEVKERLADFYCTTVEKIFF